MVRESVLVLVLASAPGCSLILDFSDKAGVHDASLDGPYTQAECDYKEPNDTVDTAAVIDPTVDMGPAAICKVPTGEDDDYYKFTVATGITKVTIMLTNAPGGGDLDLKLYDSTDQVIGQSRNFSDTETLICPAVSPACPSLAAGDYVFEVLPGSPVNLNNYTFSVTLQ
jgi:Bacterial pre-peptidase C-terminal domain